MELFLAPRAGIWCRSLSGWDAFCAARSRDEEPVERIAEPFPALLPTREGRRTPLHVRLALEAALQACRAAGLDPGKVMSVFASAMGDVQVTEYMCRTLAGPVPQLSPTRFHNSVHNAASGYWAIGTGNRLASTSIAGQEYTFAMALLEAAALAACEPGVVLLVAYDVPASVPLDAICQNRQSFSAGMVVAAAPPTTEWLPVSIKYTPEPAPWVPPSTPWLQALAEENYSARSLSLLEALASDDGWPVVLPLSASSCLQVARNG